MKIKQWIRSTALTLTVSFATVAHAGVTTYVLPGYDAYGNDLDSFLCGGRSFCAATCLERSNCSAAVYTEASGRCWLKSAANQFQEIPGETLILKILTKIDNIDYDGGDYNAFESGSWQNCSRRCFVDDRCRAFSYSKAEKKCWLKDSIVSPASNLDAVSGNK